MTKEGVEKIVTKEAWYLVILNDRDEDFGKGEHVLKLSLLPWNTFLSAKRKQATSPYVGPRDLLLITAIESIIPLDDILKAVMK